MKTVQQCFKELFPTLCKSDDAIKSYYKKEYLDNISMSTFLKNKFGETFEKELKKYL